jgi:hypothetical protein
MSYAKALRSSHSACFVVPLARTRVVETEDDWKEGESAEALAKTTVRVRKGVVVVVVGVEALLSKGPPPPRGREESAALIML